MKNTIKGFLFILALHFLFQGLSIEKFIAFFVLLFSFYIIFSAIFILINFLKSKKKEIIYGSINNITNKVEFINSENSVLYSIDSKLPLGLKIVDYNNVPVLINHNKPLKSKILITFNKTNLEIFISSLIIAIILSYYSIEYYL